ncbi:MAG: hypothetical protein NVS2B17_11740 [Candidatus Velthaea sp.]
MRLGIHLFGQPRFELGAEPFRFAAPPKTLPLLAYLLLHRNGPVARDSLAFTLWEDDPEDEARTKLRRHLHHLQHALPTGNGDPWIVAELDSLQWNNAKNVWLDVAEFERLIALPEQRDAAIALYDGDLLQNLYDDWLLLPRDRLHNAYLSALGSLVLDCRSSQQFTKACSHAQRILTIDPWREDTVRQLMSIRYEMGDRSGALQTYEHFTRQLSDEMNVEPMPETSALRELILRHAAIAGSGATSAIDDEPTHETAALPFVGRGIEMERLRATWSRAARGRGGVVFVSGEAGIGKTRLASELANLIESEGGRSIVGTTAPLESSPYQALAEALRFALPLLAAVAVEPIWLAVIGQLVPELASRRSDVPALPPVDPDREQTRLFEALAVCLGALSKTRPTVIILEDLHWAGAAMLAALEFIARRISRERLMIVATYRKEEVLPGHELRHVRRRLQSDNIAAHISINELSERAVQELIARLPDLRSADPSSLARFYEQSEGNPLFLGEVIRNFVEADHLVAQTDERPKLRSTVEARISRLSEQTQFILEIAAVLGVGFDLDLLRNVTGWDENDILDACEELVKRQLVRESGRRNDFDFVFTHHLIQTAAYDRIPGEKRKRWHRAAAHTMEELHRDRVAAYSAIVARHFQLASDFEKAAFHYLAAARTALSLFANAEALRYADVGLELSTTVSTMRFELLSVREEVKDRLGERSGQHADLIELESMARDSGDPSWLSEVLHKKIAYNRAVGERALETRAIQELMAHGETNHEAGWEAAALEAEATRLQNLGRSDLAVENAERAFHMYQSVSDSVGCLNCVSLQAAAYSELGRTAQAAACIARAHELAELLGDARSKMRVLRCATPIANVRNDYAEFYRIATQALAIAREVGDRENEASCLQGLGTSASGLLQVLAARDYFAASIELFEALRKPAGLAVSYLNYGGMEIELGNYDRAIELHRLAKLHFTACGSERGLLIVELNYGLIAEYQGEYGRAKALALASCRRARELNLHLQLAPATNQLAKAEMHLGEAEAAALHFEEALAMHRKSDTELGVSLTLADLALAYIELQKFEAARACAQELLQPISTARGRERSETRVLWAAARVFRDVGEPERSDRALSQAYEALTARLAGLPESDRAGYAGLPFHAALSAAYNEGRWP